jgi:antirestriction protein ArdC
MSATIVHNSYATVMSPPFQPAVNSSKPRGSIYEIVTEQVIKQLESGVAPWRKPWRTQMTMSLSTLRPYRGLNVFLLATQGHASRYWLTFNQCAKLGGHVKQGEHSTVITFWKRSPYTKHNSETGQDEARQGFLLQYYRVFNISQTEGLEKLGLSESPVPVPSIEQCEAIVAGMPNAPKMEQSNAAWYRQSADTVGMPARSLFTSAAEYYSTFFHELTHSTGHASRIGREGIEQLNTFGSETYSREELIAEMGAAMLCGVTGIAPATLENSVAYIQTWIARLKSDSLLLVSAASAAQKSADYIQGKQEQPIQDDGGAV